MNKKIEEVLKKYNLNIENDRGYGTIKGYEVSVFYIPSNGMFPLQLIISTYMSNEQREKVSQELKQFHFKYCQYTFTRYGLILGLSGMSASAIAKVLPNVIDQSLDCLLENGALQQEYCPICGEEISSQTATKANIDGVNVTMHQDCMTKMHEEIQKMNETYEAMPNQFGKGFVGALIGGIAGSIIAFILYMIGFISAISAVVSVLLGAFLYRKFGGKPNGIMMITVFVTTLVLQLLTIFGIYILAATGLSVEEGYDFIGFTAFQHYMSDTGFVSSFVKDLLFSALFTIVGIVCEIGTLKQSMKKEKSRMGI